MVRERIWISFGLCMLLAAACSFAAAGEDNSNVVTKSAPCPEGMALIPTGEFLAAWDNGEPDERPERIDFLNGYCIDKYEFPNKAGQKPEEGISYIDAEKKCAALGKRICSEVEWERACRGPRGEIYNDGQEYVRGNCNLNAQGAAESGSFGKCVNGYGVYDMSGNLWEWAAGKYAADSPWPLIKGGSYQKGPLFASCYARFTQPPDEAEQGDGFRCCAKPLNVEKKDAAQFQKACPGGRPQSALRKNVLTLKRDRNTSVIFHVEKTEGDRKVALKAVTVVVNTDGSAKAGFSKLNNGKLQTDWKDIDGKWANDTLVEYLDPLLADTGRIDPAQCRACRGTCIYMFKDERETWSGDVYGFSAAFFSEFDK